MIVFSDVLYNYIPLELDSCMINYVAQGYIIMCIIIINIFIWLAYSTIYF